MKIRALPIAHERVQQQEKRLKQYEQENVLLRARIALLEGPAGGTGESRREDEDDGEMLDDLPIYVSYLLGLLPVSGSG